MIPNEAVEIYISLLEEGTDCSRPTKAETLGNGQYRVLPTANYDPTDEIWEFPPGSIVRTVKRRFEGKDYLLAVNPFFEPNL